MSIYFPIEDIFDTLKTLNVNHKSYHDNLESGGRFGWSQNPEVAKAISKALTGHVKSKQHRENLSKSKLGKKLGKQSEDHKFKRAQSITGENNGMFGVKHNQQYKDDMSASCKGIRWWNNGVTNVKSKICPEGYQLGRLVPKKKV